MLMPRLLIITTNFPRWPGDPHSPWLVELLGLLREQGVQIEVLAPAYAGQGNQQIYGMPVRRFRYAPARWETLTHDEGAPNKIRRNPWYLLLLPFYLAAGMLAAWRLGRSGRFDLIHVHWPMPQGLLGLAARRAGGGRLVATFYGADLVMSRRFRWVRPFVRYFAGQCADVAAISSFTAREVVETTGVEPRIIPYGIALPPDDGAWPAQKGLILTVGRLVARKGHVFLIEAMSVLRDHSEARLVIVGEGHERPELEEAIHRLGLEDRVELTGRISDEALNRLYQDCHLFVLPAIVDSGGDTEMLGMVSLEAMRYCKPVIATRVGGIADIVQDGETGILVEQRDPGALAAAISRLLEDDTLAQQLGQAGYDFARRRFAWPAVLDQTLALYGMPAAAEAPS
jgi:glycosyltransferase involved in cell wall biosynthesis